MGETSIKSIMESILEEIIEYKMILNTINNMLITVNVNNELQFVIFTGMHKLYRLHYGNTLTVLLHNTKFATIYIFCATYIHATYCNCI